MGAGWRGRARSHAAEVAAGAVWAGFGVRSHVAPLRAVLLAWPDDGLTFAGEPTDWLMDERPDLDGMRAEALGLAETYRRSGAEVRWIRGPGTASWVAAPDSAPPNIIFACDLYFMTPEGAVLARMAAEQRAGEERIVAVALAEAGVPILATPRGNATFEGADAMWIRPDLVAVGVGRRTNEEGFRTVARVLADQGVDCVSVEIPPTVQHLLGSVNLVDQDLAVAWGASPSMRALLSRVGITVLDFESNAEVVGGRALNFVTLAPREIVMPAGSPLTRRRLEAAGITVHEQAVAQYLRAAGGIGCLTGILARA
jgi:N-dimethylarginine dimethylaminohydrolase